MENWMSNDYMRQQEAICRKNDSIALRLYD